MFYVGLDIHTKHISICALSETGQVTHRSRVRSIEEMVQILKGLPDRFEVCYEASCGYGHFHEVAEIRGHAILDQECTTGLGGNLAEIVDGIQCAVAIVCPEVDDAVG